ALLGVAIAVKAPGALDKMSGKIRLVAVPAEELIELDYRKQLKNDGVINYYGGKAEFLYRGYLDDVDMTFMIHTSHKKEHTGRLQIDAGNNGFLNKTYEFTGKASHAGGNPQDGHNALYAATTALGAANALRETFVDGDHIRFHPIITEGGATVNAIPETVKVESYVRGATVKAIKSADEKINLAFAGSAAAMGCKLSIDDLFGYMPLNNDKTLTKAFIALGNELFGEGNVINETDSIGTISTDMGDISTVIPSIHAHIGGASGSGHGADYYITDPEFAVLESAKFQVCFLETLLENNAGTANEVIKSKNLTFASKDEYFAAIDSYNKHIDAVICNDDGTVTIRYK
ncbi:MAG: peptidase dimerization domain-containing protein, partial [Clostridia bacterium]|nr:peptidase dimerization domain-containing protein [Clostridia bacterium]